MVNINQYSRTDAKCYRALVGITNAWCKPIIPRRPDGVSTSVKRFRYFSSFLRHLWNSTARVTMAPDWHCLFISISISIVTKCCVCGHHYVDLTWVCQWAVHTKTVYLHVYHLWMYGLGYHSTKVVSDIHSGYIDDVLCNLLCNVLFAISSSVNTSIWSQQY